MLEQVPRDVFRSVKRELGCKTDGCVVGDFRLEHEHEVIWPSLWYLSFWFDYEGLFGMVGWSMVALV